MESPRPYLIEPAKDFHCDPRVTVPPTNRILHSKRCPRGRRRRGGRGAPCCRFTSRRTGHRHPKAMPANEKSFTLAALIHNWCQARPAALPAPASPSSSTAPTALIAVAHLMRHRAPPGTGGSDQSAPRTAPLSAEATYAATLTGSANSPASGRQTGTIAKLPGRQPVTMAPSDLGEGRAGATAETPLTGCMALEPRRTS